MMFLKFSLLFILSHIVAYIIAGAISLKISEDIYKTKNRHCDFLRDMSEEEESKHVKIYFFPAQIIRGFLMSVVILPLLNNIVILSNFLIFIFFSGLMFIYTHIASVSPFMDNIEGYVYLKEKYFKKKFFIKFQLEMIIYSILFGLFITLFIRHIY